MRPIAEVFVLEEGERMESRSVGARLVPVDEPVGARGGNGFQKERFDERKNRGRGADPDADREDRQRGVARRETKLAERKSEVANEGVHRRARDGSSDSTIRRGGGFPDEGERRDPSVPHWTRVVGLTVDSS